MTNEELEAIEARAKAAGRAAADTLALVEEVRRLQHELSYKHPQPRPQ